MSGAGRGAVDPFGDPGPSPRRGRGGRLPRRRDVPNTRPLPEWVKRLAWVLDDAFEVPGLPGRRVGVDGLIALVPVVGDAAGSSPPAPEAVLSAGRAVESRSEEGVEESIDDPFTMLRPALFKVRAR